jgi:hypothetical protein
MYLLSEESFIGQEKISFSDHHFLKSSICIYFMMSFAYHLKCYGEARVKKTGDHHHHQLFYLCESFEHILAKIVESTFCKKIQPIQNHNGTPSATIRTAFEKQQQQQSPHQSQ